MQKYTFMKVITESIDRPFLKKVIKSRQAKGVKAEPLLFLLCIIDSNFDLADSAALQQILRLLSYSSWSINQTEGRKKLP